MAKAFNTQATLAKANKRALDWANTGANIAHRRHDTAPRRGNNLNAFGQRRSAPGDPPAEEYGTLLRILDEGAFRAAGGYVFNVNYHGLEYGSLFNGYVVEPRPLGVITLNALKAQARRGKGPTPNG